MTRITQQQGFQLKDKQEITLELTRLQQIVSRRSHLYEFYFV